MKTSILPTTALALQVDWLDAYVRNARRNPAICDRWLWTYNHDRPHMALGGITPQQKLALAA